MMIDLRKNDIAELDQSSRNAQYRLLAKLKRDHHYVLLDPKCYKEDDDEQKGRRAAEAMKELVRVLGQMYTADSRLLQCDGWYEDQAQEQFYLVFRLPPNIEEPLTKPLFLDEFYSTYRPGLHMRFQLARALASAVLEVHKQNWLHKGIRSDNVIFFHRNKNEKRSMGDPKLIGFDYSRKDMPDVYSEKPIFTAPTTLLFRATHANLYRHPDALRNPTVHFNRLHDYYALGVVLVEIAWWSPMETILRKHQELQGEECLETDVEKVQDTLLDRDVYSAEQYQAVLTFTMGDIYRDVVNACLKSDFDVGVNESMLLESFERRVLGPLQKIVV
ncbi:uncharacterized protein KY384_001600 [Bacidia gigantensis]|uniref:uncharacterized protein n=1 Tax=Bacidia gigantensis TaxID=2732470 RepID=UPI001D03DB3B|nr:uncharacterized protein KY384_001600 [Bacidia gigantensis]KAG8533859.1 hypothetical protein KY384_001600 [Bacidia gigantensis]